MFQIRSIPLHVKSEMTSKVIENMRSNYSDNSNALEIINLLETRLEEIKKATVARDFVDITAELVKADLDRDNAYRSVVRICEGYLSAGVGHAGYNEANEIYNELGSDGLAFLQGSMHAERVKSKCCCKCLRSSMRLSSPSAGSGPRPLHIICSALPRSMAGRWRPGQVALGGSGHPRQVLVPNAA